MLQIWEQLCPHTERIFLTHTHALLFTHLHTELETHQLPGPGILHLILLEPCSLKSLPSPAVCFTCVHVVSLPSECSQR